MLTTRNVICWNTGANLYDYMLNTIVSFLIDFAETLNDPMFMKIMGVTFSSRDNSMVAAIFMSEN